MARTRQRTKGRREGGSFISLPHAVVECANYTRLPYRAVKLLIDLYGQYRGANNSDFTMAWKIMQQRRWRFKDQLNKARGELLDRDFIVQTRQGWNNHCSLYAVTFQRIDECWGKLDIRPTTAALGWWKDGPPEKNRAPQIVPMCPAWRVKDWRDELEA